MGFSSWRRAVAWASVLAASLALAGLGAAPAASPAVAAEPGVVVMTAAGDIDGCHQGEATAKLVAKTAGPVATIGDYAYPEGTAEGFAKCYDPVWGVVKDRTRPVPGNHDYDVSKGAPYYQYFGASAGQPGKGWYSYDAGSWHVVALNSNCDAVDCGEQGQWLDNDLRAHPSACILAYWHHPRFTSGQSGGDSAVGGFWKVLYNHGASVVLNGHDHDYERFAPQDPSGHADRGRGIREFVVGTGGAILGSLASTAPNSEVRNNRTFGVLELTLRPDGYDWRFVPAAGDSFTDSGSDTCRGTAPAPAAAPTSEAPAPSQPEPEAPAPAVEDSDTTDPGPPADFEPSPASDDPPAAGRRQPASIPPAASSSPSRPDRTAGSGSGAAKPASSRAEGPWVPPAIATPPSLAPPAPFASDPAADAPPADGPRRGPPEPADAAADNSALVLAISGLVEPAPAPSRTDRRGVALVAVALMAADCAAIGSLHRRGHRVFSA